METASVPEPRQAQAGGWIVEHDDRRSFVLPYLALSVGCSLFVSLFWLLVLVGIHLTIELARARRFHLEPRLGRALWEIKLDLALLLLALSMAVYMDVAFGVLGLGASARAGGAAARAGARSSALRRALRAAFLVLDDIVRVLGIAVAAKGIGKGAQSHADVPPTTPPWRSRWSWGDRIAIALGAGVALLLILSPWLSGHDLEGILGILLAELHPFPRE